MNSIRPRLSCHAETASITIAPVTSEARITWMYPHTNTGLVNRSPIELSTGRPVVELVA